MPNTDVTRKITKAVDDGFDAQLKFTADLTRLASLRGRKRRRRISWPAPTRDRGLALDRWKIEVEDIQGRDREFSPAQPCAVPRR